jgi:hypothetical protein
MLAEGRRAAREKGVVNIRWVRGRAEDLPAVAPGPYRLVTFGQGTAPPRTHRFEDVLARTRFVVPQQFFAPGIPDLLRDSESVLSGYFSLSSAAPHLFGDRLDDFAAEVRALLAHRSTEGIFWDWPGDTEVVIAHKPG